MPFGADTPPPQRGLIETLVATSRVVACDGDGGGLGHPRVWLRIEGTQTFCPWCSRVYVLDPRVAESGDAGH